jgi:hypothetical protein
LAAIASKTTRLTSETVIGSAVPSRVVIGAPGVRGGFETFDFPFIENVLEHLLLAALASERQLPDRPRMGSDPLEIEQGAMTANRASDTE